MGHYQSTQRTSLPSSQIIIQHADHTSCIPRSSLPEGWKGPFEASNGSVWGLKIVDRRQSSSPPCSTPHTQRKRKEGSSVATDDNVISCEECKETAIVVKQCYSCTKSSEIAALRQRCFDIMIGAHCAAREPDDEYRGLKYAVSNIFCKAFDPCNLKPFTADTLAAWLWERGCRA